MIQFAIFYGEGDGGRLYEAGSGFTDDGVAYQLYAKSDPIFPAGAGGEAIFPAVYLAMTWSAAITLKLTPVVDGIEQTASAVTLQLSARSRRTEVVEVAFMEDLLDQFDQVVGKQFLRGQSFALLLQTTSVAAGDFIVDALDLEYEPVLERHAAEVSS